MRHRTPVALLGFFLAAAAAPLADAAPVERTVDVDGVSRSYLITVPEAWDRKSPIPLLLVFHGAGSDSESMVRATGFEEMSDRDPLLVVHPKATLRVKRYDVDATGGTSADLRFVDVLLERLKERFPIDSTRIYATGFSNGAAFCYRLAAERPQVVAAIAPVAGYLPRLATDANAIPVPAIHVHGTADGVVSAGDSPIAGWAQRNRATGAPRSDVLPGTAPLVIRRTTYGGASSRSDATLLLVEGAGHTWSGGPRGPVSRAILEFLFAHPLSAAPAASPSGNHPMVGTPFGSIDALRWRTPEGGPVSLGAQRLTLFRWWTNGCPHCTGSVPALARIEDRYRARGLRMVAVYHPKGANLSDAGAVEEARRLGFSGAVAFDDRWTKYAELRDRGGLTRATSITVIVDSQGVIRWVHPGPRIEAGSPDIAALEAFLEQALPPTPASSPAPTR